MADLKELDALNPHPAEASCPCAFCNTYRSARSAIEDRFRELEAQILTPEEARHINRVSYNPANRDECSLCDSIDAKLARSSSHLSSETDK